MDRYSIEGAAVQAVTAGCDAVLICTDPDAQERARLALAAHAERDATFANRLREASDRVRTLRERGPARPAREPSALQAALSSATHAEIRDEILRRTPAR